MLKKLSFALFLLFVCRIASAHNFAVTYEFHNHTGQVVILAVKSRDTHALGPHTALIMMPNQQAKFTILHTETTYSSLAAGQGTFPLELGAASYQERKVDGGALRKSNACLQAATQLSIEAIKASADEESKANTVTHESTIRLKIKFNPDGSLNFINF